MDETLPTRLQSVAELDDFLSRPSPGLVAFMRELDGDLMIVGAGGKIGPTMARLAKRAVDAAGVRKKVFAVDVAPMDALAAAGIETLRCDLMDLDAVAQLPTPRNIVYMIGREESAALCVRKPGPCERLGR